jgi:uncharacterized repeat protein (TIGR01451 family)/uncharacterized repeat protein (TIGR02543 family)
MNRKKLVGIIIACAVVAAVAIVLAILRPWGGAASAQTYTLTTAVNPRGTGLVSPSGRQYESGVQVTITASPASGYTFDHWSGSASDTSPTISITMDHDYSVTANFMAASVDRYDLTISSTQGGSVTTPGEGMFTYSFGMVANLVATPASGYQFVDWTGDVGSIANVNAASTTITMNGSYSIRANFETIPVSGYSLTVSSSAGGSITTPGEGTFLCDPGIVVSLVATPATGYYFVNWTGNVGTIANVNAASTTITMNGDCSITANFAAIPAGQYNLTISSTAGGAVTSPGEGTFTRDAGRAVNLVASPASGYHFVNWTGDVGTIADVNDASTTIIMSGDCTITANFASLPSITVTSPNGGENWNTGSIQTITWTSSGITGGVCIDISRDGGSSWSDIITNTANDDSQSWTVAGPATTRARIRVRSASDGSIWDMSNDDFTIGLLSPDFSVKTYNYEEVSKMFAVVGDVLTFTIHYRNTGNMDATGVVITDVVDTNLRDVTPQDGGSYDAETRTITWNIGAVAVNAGGTVHFAAVVPPLCNDTVVYNSATIDSDQTAPEDAPTTMIWVTIDVWIILTSDVSPDPTTVGQVTNFIATVSGPAPSYSWSWTVDGTEVATTQNASYTFTSAGVYDVCVTVTDCGDNANAHSCHYVTVNPPS